MKHIAIREHTLCNNNKSYVAMTGMNNMGASQGVKGT